jgi:hypothetical protein
VSVASVLIALLVALSAAPAAAATCSVRPRLNRIPTLRAHVDFPVDFQATLRQTCGSVQWQAIIRPPGFDIDDVGGRFYWTPVRPGVEQITLQVTQTNESLVGTRTKRFRAIVDDNTLTYPLFRDYLAQAATVPIRGRAHGTYTLEYADQATPTVRLPIAGPIATPVETTGLLADWDIRNLPDGGRYILYLTTKPGRSLVTNPVIIDRSALPGWPKRVEAIAESVVVGDLDDDGIDEVFAVTLPGELYAWRIDGTELFEVEGYGPARTAPSIGDIDGDGRPEVVWSTEWELQAHRLDGTPVPGFPTARDASRSVRSPLTLADLDGDGVLDIVAVSRDPGGISTIRVYRYESGAPVPLAGWPQAFGDSFPGSSASVGDLDGDHAPEVIVTGWDRVYAWHADGTPVAGLHGALLAVPITGAETNTGVAGRATAQPAVADLDGDGNLEIVVGSNVLRTNGTPAAGWAGGRPSARNVASAAIGDLDGIPGNGLEVVLAADAWHADGTALAGWPRTDLLTTGILGDLGTGGLAVIAGTRYPGAPGVAAYRSDGGPVAAFPKSLYGYTGDIGASVVGDFDADGLVDVAAAITDAAYGGVVAVWNVWAPNHDERHPWPMLGHDVRHSGFYTVPPPNRPTNLTVRADGGGQHLAWLDASAVEERYVVERSASGAAWTWTAAATLPANSTTWDDPDVGTYRYRVRADRTDPRSGDVIGSRPSASAP